MGRVQDAHSSVELFSQPSKNLLNALLTVRKKIPSVAENFFASYFGEGERKVYVFWYLNISTLIFVLQYVQNLTI